jgi:hypothetical protein
MTDPVTRRRFLRAIAVVGVLLLFCLLANATPQKWMSVSGAGVEELAVLLAIVIPVAVWITHWGAGKFRTHPEHESGPRRVASMTCPHESSLIRLGRDCLPRWP